MFTEHGNLVPWLLVFYLFFFFCSLIIHKFSFGSRGTILFPNSSLVSNALPLKNLSSIQTPQFQDAAQGLASRVYLSSCMTMSGKARISLIALLVQVCCIFFHLHSNSLQWKILNDERGEGNKERWVSYIRR